MPSANKTANLGLNQWQGNEYPKRQDFVDDNKKIDDAMGSTMAHLSETMPHKFVDGTTTYKYGFSVVNGVLMFNYEEVV